MAWLIGAILAVLLFLAPLIGYFTQPWSAFWLAGATTNPPGVVPPAASVAPVGPIQNEDGRLMAAIAPWMGAPYLFGGCARSGVDCSCFTQAVFRALGVGLPRTAQQQYDATAHPAQPEIGDLVFFERTYASPDRVTHVGIYVGLGWMVSAAEPGVGRQSLGAPFWASHLVGFGRIRGVSNQA